MHSDSQYDYDPHTGEYPEAVVAEHIAMLSAASAREEEARLAGIRERVHRGIKSMADDFVKQGINPIVGLSVGSLMGVLGTMLDHASDEQVDTMLQKMIELMGDWRRGDSS